MSIHEGRNDHTAGETATKLREHRACRGCPHFDACAGSQWNRWGGTDAAAFTDVHKCRECKRSMLWGVDPEKPGLWRAGTTTVPTGCPRDDASEHYGTAYACDDCVGHGFQRSTRRRRGR